MIMKNRMFLSLLFVFGLIGCGTSSSLESTNSSLTVHTNKATLESSSKEMNLGFSIDSSYSTKVEVNVEKLVLNIAPCQIQNVTFSPSSFLLKGGEKQDIEATVFFENECTPTSYSLKGETVLTLEGKTNNGSFSSSSKDITPTINSVVAGENNASTPIVVGDITLPIVVIPSELKEVALTSNSKELEIPIKVFKDIAPFTSGSVKVELPKKVLNGTNVGQFTAYEVPVNEQGIALFNYTGPSNLKVLMDKNDTNSIFKFYHISNSENKEALKMIYNLSEDNSYVPINYELTVSTQENIFNMGIPSIQKTFSIVLKDIEGNVVNDKDIEIIQLSVETQNGLIAKILNTSTRELVDFLDLKKENNSPFILETKTLSGIVPIKVEIEFIDINKETKKLSTIINIRVMSGPPSAISLSYVGSNQDSTKAKYEEIFAVTVTDEYANKVNSNPYISLGAIIGYAVDGRELSSEESHLTKRLYYGRKAIDSGKANGFIDNLNDNNVHETYFTDNIPTDVFQWVNKEGNNSDKLLIFGKGKNYEAMGKWDFEQIDNNTLSLQDDYFGEDRTDLYYAVGHNYYQDQCLDDGREWLGSTDSETYQLDDEGTVRISYKYDYNLMGKDALIWVNLNGYQSDTAKNTRIGEVLKHTLRGKGLTKVPLAGYSLDKNETAPVTFKIYHEATNKRYRNAHFTYDVKEGSSCNIIGIQSSNDYDARACNNGLYSDGTAYVTFLLKAEEDKECTFDITRLRFLPEF